MFQLHDRTRRRIALAMFFALGILPTLIVWGWAAWWRSGRYVRWEEQRLKLQLGMHVRLSAVQHPRPGVVLYQDLTLSEPETGQPVFHCDAVEAQWDWVPLGTGSSQPSLALTVFQPKILASAWDEVWRLLDRALCRRIELDERGLQITAKELTIFNGKTAWIKLADLEGHLDATPERSRAEVEFHLAGDNPKSLARFHVTRNRQVTPAAIQLDFASGSTPLPCALLAVGLPAFRAGGPAAKFEGAFRAVSSRSGPDGELHGRFTGVDLEQLVRDPLPQQLAGTANVSIETARFHDGRLQEVHGSVIAESGAISRSLVAVAVEHLGLTPGSAIDHRGPMIPFDSLAARFVCDGKGLRLQGLPSSGSPATILAGRLGPILGESPSPSTPQPLAGVIQALFLDTEEILPLSRKSDRVLNHLPASEAMPR
jgi:hypothetical protein